MPATTTIRRRLILLTLGLVLLGLLIGGLLLWDSYRNSRSAFERQLLETARALSLVVDRELGQAAASNRALATSVHLARGDLRAFDAQARKVATGENTWIVLSDEKGQQVVNTRAPYGSPLPKDADPADLWQHLRRGEAVVSNLIPGTVPEQRAISIDSPVQVGNEVRYSLSFVMLPAVFDRIMSDQKLPSGWIGNILDQDLNIVARSYRSDAAIGLRASPAVAQRLSNMDAGVLESVSIEGVPTIVAYSRSPAYRWIFGVSVPRSQLYASVTRSLVLAGGGGLVLLLLGALIALMTARSISRPVEGLAQAAQALGRREAIMPPDTGIREIRAVAENLQRAAEELAMRDADLRASESRLRLAVQATGIGIWDVDLASGRRTWSHEFRAMAGVPDDIEADPHVLFTLMHPEDVSWVRERYDAFFRGMTGGYYEAEFRICHGITSEERWVVSSGRLVYDKDRTPVRASGTMMDVTERKRVEETLRESEERFRSIADSAPALIWMTNAEGQSIYLNRYHEELFGCSVDTLYGDGWANVVIAEDVEKLRAVFLHAFERRDPFYVEIRVRDASGTTRWLHCEGAPRSAGPNGEFLGYVGCNIDITQSKLAADALERRIEERTGELAAANRQLLAQIEERERVEETLRQVQRLEAVGQLTSGVAHDFNNLLTVILGNLSFTERSISDPALLKRMSNMRMAAERGASLVSQLLAFSRRQRLEPKNVNLNETVSGMRELLQSSMGGSVAVDIVLEEDLWPALVDPTQIELIILNLAINARDAMEVGGLLKVETSNVVLDDEPTRPEEPAPGEYVVVSVVDSGTGMADDVMTRVFEPFFTTKDVGKGSGLGLSQVLGFAKQSGGGVRIETSEGRGTTVFVFLPRASGAPQQSGRKAPRTRAPVAEVPGVLLVDDDDLVREVTASKLEELGFRVTQASNGPSALLELEQDPSLDLLILDFAMPGMNGAEVARAARKRRPNVPVMFLTGYADLTALGEFAGEPVLHKPFRDDELRQRVASLLKGGKVAAETAQMGT